MLNESEIRPKDGNDENTCIWQLEEFHEYYATECGEAFSFSHDKPFEDGKFKYCPYCGREIKVK